jgi:hypothetical protein
VESKNKIYPFTILVIVGLGLQIVNMLLSLFNLPVVYIIIIQVLGNVSFGVGLIGYFINIKQNNLLKWSSLILGIFSILNLDSINNLLSYFINNFNLYSLLRVNFTTISVSIYVIIVDSIFIGYAFSFYQLTKVNFLISAFTRLFIGFKSVYLAFSLVGLFSVKYLSAFLEIEFDTFFLGRTSTIINVIATALMMGTFIVLFVLQSVWNKDIKITSKDPNFLD